MVMVLGLGLSLFAYLGVIRMEGMLEEQVSESFPNLGRIHRLLDVVQDTRRLLEQMPDLESNELAVEVQAQKKHFLDTFLDSQSKKGSFILKSLKGDFFSWVDEGLAFHQKFMEGDASLDWKQANAINARSVELHLKLERYREYLVDGHLDDLEEIRSSLSFHYTLIAFLMGIQLTLGLSVFYVLQREGALVKSEKEADESPKPSPVSLNFEEEALSGLKEKDPWWEMVHGDEPIYEKEKGLAITGGRENVFEKVLLSFRDATPSLLADLDKAIESKDVELIEVLIHRLKGSARCVGAQRLGSWAESLEKECKEMKPVLLRRAHECLCDQFTAWQRAVRDSSE